MNIFLYGQAGVGKSTIANEIVKQWTDFVNVDGDEVRKLNWNFGYGREARMKNVQTGIEIAKHHIGSGSNVVCSFMAPYIEMREMIRRELPGVLLVYLYYDFTEITRGKEDRWCKEFEYAEDYDLAINTGEYSLIESLQLIKQITKQLV